MTDRVRPCPSCASEDIDRIVEIPDVPVHVGSLWPSAEEARACPRGDIDWCHCRNCELIFNATFDSARMEYAQDYDNSLEGSAVFMAYLSELARDLIERYALRDKTIVEIGCGKGRFVGLLAELGPNTGIGFDTTYDASAPNPAPDRLSFVKAHYSAEQTEGKPDLVACRHVFEHIPEPMPFLEMLRDSLDGSPQAIVYFEVPETLWIVRDMSIWDIIYEHCNYFGHESLGSIFARAGFEILRVSNGFDDQFLGIEARPCERGAGRAPQVSEALRIGDRVREFGEHFRQKKVEWGDKLRKFDADDKRVAIWAAGAKTVSFMNLFQVADQIDCIVDINERKQGTFLPGTGHEVMAPDALIDRRPDAVVVMNAKYRDEIAAQLREMGLEPEILTA